MIQHYFRKLESFGINLLFEIKIEKFLEKNEMKIKTKIKSINIYVYSISSSNKLNE
jgi:hypothetical protein